MFPARRRNRAARASRATPGWGGGKLNATTSPSRRSPTTRRRSSSPSLLGTPVLEAETQTALLERAGGNPLVRGAVRRALPRTRIDGRAPAPGDTPGHHRRTPRRSRIREKALCRMPRSSARSSGRVARPRPRGAQHSSTGTQGIRPPPASFVRRRSDRGGLRARTGPRCRLRPDSAGRARRSIEGRRVDRSLGGPKITPRCSPTTGALRSISCERAARTTTELSERRASAPGRRRPRLGLNNYATSASLYEDALELWP